MNNHTLKQQIQDSYKVPVAGILPVCEEMFDLASSDIFCMRYPEHPWTKTIAGIAQHLSENNRPVNNSFNLGRMMR
jgi:MinD-like ATPase involved in chromosome partitioning or flagellar assembly